MVSFQPVFRELNEMAEASLFQRSPTFQENQGDYIKKPKEGLPGKKSSS